MSGLDDFRAQHPEYADVPDLKLADGLYAKFYSAMPRDQFDAKMGLATPAAPAGPTDDSALGGFALGVSKPLERVAQAGIATSPAFGNNPDGAVGAGMKALLAKMKALRANNSRKGFQAAGEFAGTLPTTAMPGGPLVGNAVAGALTSDADDAAGVATDAAIGAGAGRLGDAATRGLSRVISPKVAPVVARLKAAGVPMTPGQILGGAAQKIEDKVTSLPIVGDAIVAAKRRALDAYNRGAVAKVLEPIGKKLSDSIETGHAAVSAAGDTISDQYQQLLSNITAAPDAWFNTALSTIEKKAGSVMSPERAQLLLKILQDKVRTPLTNSAGDGRVAKRVQSELTHLASNYGSSADAGDRLLGQSLGDAKDDLGGLFMRNNPAQARDLTDANAAWARLVRLEGAAKATPDGVFTPAQLMTSVRQADKSTRKRAVGRGEALMQQYAADGVDRLGSKVPDSGTTGRALMAGGLAGLGGVPAVAGAGAAALPYSPAGIRLLMNAMTGRQGKAPKMIARAVEDRAPLAGLLAAITGRDLVDAQ